MEHELGTRNSQPGTLFLVATPVGNLGDITLRALDTLKAVDVIACEDTRHTGKLLAHYGIGKPMVSLHDHNERARTPELVKRLQAGESIALVSDGDTPLVSDPGWLLVHEAIKAGVTVTWVPGAAALVGGLVLSGLPAERFVFEGFLPVKPGARRKRLEALVNDERTVVLYESPHRLLKTLDAIREVFGDIRVVCARELTKLFEEVRREPVSTMLDHFTAHAPKGEFVVVFNPTRGT